MRLMIEITSSEGGVESRHAGESAEARESTQRPYTTVQAQAKNDWVSGRVLGAGTDRRLSGTTVQEPAGDVRLPSNADGRATEQGGVASTPSEPFDRKKYQREYMRKRRAARKAEGKV